jgi:hypothetical protein
LHDSGGELGAWFARHSALYAFVRPDRYGAAVATDLDVRAKAYAFERLVAVH